MAPGPDPVHPHRRRPDRRPVHRQHRPGAGRADVHRDLPGHARSLDPRGGPGRAMRDGADRRPGVGRCHPRPDLAERAGHPAGDRGSRSASRCCWRWSARSLLERRLRRRTMGLSFPDLRALYEQREAVLHAIGEGLLVFDTDGRRRGRQRRSATAAFASGGAADPRAASGLAGSAGADGTLTDETHVTADRVLLVNQQPVQWEGREVGTVMTLRDRTELQRVSGELSSVTQFAESLRSRAHEADNRLHTVITMVELGRADDAVRVRDRGTGGVPAAHRPTDVDGRRTRPGGAAARQDESGPRSRRRTHRHRRIITGRSRQRCAHPGRTGHAGRQSRRQRDRCRARRRTRLGGGDGARQR